MKLMHEKCHKSFSSPSSALVARLLAQGSIATWKLMQLLRADVCENLVLTTWPCRQICTQQICIVFWIRLLLLVVSQVSSQIGNLLQLRFSVTDVVEQSIDPNEAAKICQEI